MKGQRKNRLRQKQVRENRLIICIFFGSLVLFGLMFWGIMSIPPIASPTQMVAGQVVHGAKSENFKARPARQTFAKADFSKHRDYLPLSFADLSSFPFNVTDDMVDPKSNVAGVASNVLQQIPDSIRSLSDKKIAITGFMLPVRLDGKYVSEFMVLKDRSACCYGRTPRINEWIIARVKTDGTKPVLDTPVTAVGTFHVGEQCENGALAAIYELDCDSVIYPNK